MVHIIIQLIEHFKEENADKLILLGDILYHGPRNPLTKEYNPAKVADMLNEYKDQIICVREIAIVSRPNGIRISY